MATNSILKKFSLGCFGLLLFLIVLTVAVHPDSEPYPTIPYEEITGANSGTDTQILIDSKYVNEADMLTLGRQLARENEYEDYARISIFTDRNAAALFDKVLSDTLTPEEDSFYVKNYVGQYNKNESQNFEIYVSQLNGLDVDDNDLGDDITYESADLR